GARRWRRSRSSGAPWTSGSAAAGAPCGAAARCTRRRRGGCRDVSRVACLAERTRRTVGLTRDLSLGMEGMGRMEGEAGKCVLPPSSSLPPRGEAGDDAHEGGTGGEEAPVPVGPLLDAVGAGAVVEDAVGAAVLVLVERLPEVVLVHAPLARLVGLLAPVARLAEVDVEEARDEPLADDGLDRRAAHPHLAPVRVRGPVDGAGGHLGLED